MQKYDVHLNKINQSSRLYKALCSLTSRYHFDIQKKSCVNISFGDDYEEYISHLSKSTRQNIRTAHNRIGKENKQLSVETYIGKSISQKESIQLNEIYQKRASERSGKRNKIVQFFQEKINPVTVSLNNCENSFVSVLKINSKVAAYMQGFISNCHQSVVIPRLAINSDFNVYCPGGLLITQTIHWLQKNSQIRNLDLSRGDEKYKFVYGGLEHCNFDFYFPSNSNR